MTSFSWSLWPRRRTSASKLRVAKLSAAFGFGAVTAYFLDPPNGKRRRHVLRDRLWRLVRRTGRLLSRKAKYEAGRAQGLVAEARTTIAPSDVATDDTTVKQRILSDALRDVPVSTKKVEVDVRDGVATLRGEVPTQTLVDELVKRVRNVPGVRDVQPSLTVGSERS
jgi:BON domain